jgi:beta-N-acetylhexosaminidase
VLTPRRLLALGVLTVAAVALIGLALSHGADNSAGVRNPGPSPPRQAAHHPVSPELSLARGLSLDQLAGQRVIYAYAGTSPPRSLIAAIRSGEAAGVIFFGANISSPNQIRGVIRRLQAARKSSPVRAPLLMLVDQEGGEVRRLPGAPVPSQKLIGESPDAVRLARAAGSGAGRNLNRAAISVNLAPVLDVYRTPGNFIDEFQRSYSDNPRTVARLGATFVPAQQHAGVAATAKHFPGLGAAATGQNTDAEPTTLRLSLHALRAVDEAPYRSAIAAGVKLVMSSWAVYPSLDAHRPAGLSPTVIGSELRGRLGFRGVTITDALGAGGLRHFGTIGQRGVLAARAGEDLLICTAIGADDRPALAGTRVRRAIASAFRRGALSSADARQATARILALRGQIG